jgi:hypothetical protein
MGIERVDVAKQDVIEVSPAANCAGKQKEMLL